MPGVVAMAQSLELPGLGPYGKWELEDWGCQGLWVWRSRWNCEGSDPAGTASSRIGDARGCGHGAVAGTASARSPRESPAGGLGMPGVVGMAQSPELRGRGPYGNWQLEDWGCQGSWARSSRRNCEGLDRTRTRTPRTRIEEDEEWGYGLTVPRSERSPMLDVCETFGLAHQVWRAAGARPRRSRRARSPTESSSEPPSELPCAPQPNAQRTFGPSRAGIMGPLAGGDLARPAAPRGPP